MASINELSIWLCLGIFQWIGLIFAIREYRKRNIIPYLYISAELFSTGAFGFCFLIGRLFENIFWMQMGFVALSFIGVFGFAFFQVIFGQSRAYILLQTVQIILFTISVISVFIHPPILEPDEIVSSSTQKIFFFLGLGCSGIIVSHYSFVAWRRVRQDKLSRKLLIVPYITLLILASSTGVYWAGIPAQFALIPVLVGLSIMVIAMIFIPSLPFIVLIRPQHLALISQNGDALYSEQFEENIEPKLIHGAVAAINVIFNQYRSDKEKTNLHLLTFPDQVIYVEFRENFFIMLIDTQYSSFVEKHFTRFTDTISGRVIPLLDNEEVKGDQEKFSFIKPIFHEMFSFIPRFA